MPITIDPAMGFNAGYFGPRNAHIKLGAQLVSALPREEIKAICAHEIGHRELYHVERCWAVITAGYALALLGPVWSSFLWAFAALAGLAIAEFLRLLVHEIEADAYACRSFGVKLYRRAWLKIPRPDPPHWTTRIRLWFLDRFEAFGW